MISKVQKERLYPVQQRRAKLSDSTSEVLRGHLGNAAKRR